MPLWANLAVQLVNVGLSVVVPAVVHNPATLAGIGKYATVAAAVAATISHFFNTDGTPQSQAKK